MNPLVHEGEVTVDQQLPGNIGVSASYVFSRALHLPVFTDANLSPTIGHQNLHLSGRQHLYRAVLHQR